MEGEGTCLILAANKTWDKCNLMISQKLEPIRYYTDENRANNILTKMKMRDQKDNYIILSLET